MLKEPRLKFDEPVCELCKKSTGRLQWCAIVRRGRLEVREAWLHPGCEQGYLELIDPA
jgi:hypothetical protein